MADGSDFGTTPPPPPPPPEQPADQLPSRSLGEILSAAFDIYRNKAADLILIVAIVVVPLSVIGWLLSHFAFAAPTKTVVIAGHNVKVIEGRSFGIFILAALVAAAISVITTAILQAAILRAAAQATINDPVDVEASYRWGLRRFGSVLLVSIMVGIVVAIGFILLIIPGIILLVFFSISIPSVVVESRRGREAMRRSWNLVKGHFWHVLGVIVVTAIITGIIQSVLRAIAGHTAILELILGTAGQVLVAPFSALVTVLLYLDMRARSEGITASGLRSELAAP
jgi:membrane-anchored glycerophosphoryl diester phosphodiesterase (GDPDase)